MSEIDYTLKRRDRLPTLRATLLDADGEPVDLTGATVRFYMRLSGDADVKVDGLCNVVDAPNGEVEYEWAAEDTEDADRYEAEFEAIWGDGKPMTFPNDRFLNFLIHRDIIGGA